MTLSRPRRLKRHFPYLLDSDEAVHETVYLSRCDGLFWFRAWTGQSERWGLTHAEVREMVWEHPRPVGEKVPTDLKEGCQYLLDDWVVYYLGVQDGRHLFLGRGTRREWRLTPEEVRLRVEEPRDWARS